MKTDPPAEGRARSLAQDCLLGLAVAMGIAGAALWRHHDLPTYGCLLAACIFLAAWLITRHLDKVVNRRAQWPEELRKTRLESIEEEERAMRLEDILRRRPRLPKEPPDEGPAAAKDDP